MPKLYELASAYAAIQALIESEDGNDWTEALATLTDSIEVKVENIARLIKSTESDRQAYDDEMRRLSLKAAACDNSVKRLKDYLKTELEKMGLDKVKGVIFTVALQASPPSCTVLDETAVDPRFKRLVPEHYDVDRRAIIEAWKAGENVAGAEVMQSRHVRIR